MSSKNIEQLQEELNVLADQLAEANEMIEAIRTGQIDALVVNGGSGHQLYTLKTADHIYRVFIEKMTEGAITLNPDGVILYSNSRFAEMTGQPLTNVIGMPFVNFVAEDDKERFMIIIDASWQQDNKEEICLVTDSGQMPVQVSLTALALEEGPALSLFLTDLTAQKRTQKQLEENNRQLSQLNQALEASNSDLLQFASVASHDLQEPLRKIQIFSNLLKAKSNDTEKADVDKYTDKIIDAASRMRTLIIDILNYSKLSAHDNLFAPLDLNNIVAEVLEDFEMHITEKRAHVTVGELPCIYGIRGQVRQVFQNIVSNALKFISDDKEPVIDISACRLSERSFAAAVQADGPYCLIMIKDNGIGFDEKYHANIFALFERLNSKESYEGTGIGMAVTKKIMEKHNGLVMAKSKPGDGAIFLLIFPITQPEHDEKP